VAKPRTGLFDGTFSTQAAKELARRFGGDRSSADWRHFGRLAGFTNQKPKRRLQTGLPPFIRLHECEGRTYRAAREFLEDVKSLAKTSSGERTAWTRFSSTEDSVRLAEFHSDPRYDGDMHRADMAWALHAASRGLAEQQIRDEILHARDLSKKGGAARQLDYAQRTAIKALSAVDLQAWVCAGPPDSAWIAHNRAIQVTVPPTAGNLAAQP
jgi:RepB DNA-primase from phage plasmid